MFEILVLYYSHRGTVRALAQQIARGIDATPGVVARVRTVPKVSSICEASEADGPAIGAPHVTPIDLEECVGLWRLGVRRVLATWRHR
jgi:NAD(P)H dehydrogenase (quinone)